MREPNTILKNWEPFPEFGSAEKGNFRNKIELVFRITLIEKFLCYLNTLRGSNLLEFEIIK